jgi:hypothetical protein
VLLEAEHFLQHLRFTVKAVEAVNPLTEYEVPVTEVFKVAP